MDLAKRIAALSPEKRKLLLQQLDQENANNSALLPIVPQGREINRFPLSFPQERLWFLHQMDPENHAYNMPAAIRLKGNLNLPCLEQALNEILNRHEVLRTNFDMVDDQPVQIISDPKPWSLIYTDLSHLPIEEQRAESSKLTEEESKRPFDLRRDLLIRSRLLKLSSQEHIFLMTMHHIVSDGWSITVFFRELTSLYNDFVNSQSSSLSPLTIQYADFAQWQHNWLEGEILERQLGYWKKQLATPLPVLNLPTDYSRPKVQSFNGAKLSLTLSQSLTKELKGLCHTEGATVFMLLLAAFNVLLYRYTGQSDIVIGTPIAGRNRGELEDLIGVFLNTLVMRVNLEGNPSFRELIKRVRNTSLEAYANQDIPFEKLLEELQPERSLSRTPIFQIFFNMLNLNDVSVDLPELTIESITRPDVEAKFDLTLYITEQTKQIQVFFVYNTDLYREERIAEMTRQLEFLLKQMAEAPDSPIDSYSLATPQSNQILPDPTKPLDESEQVSIHQMIHQWMKQTPDHPAIVQNEWVWSYADLGKCALTLAQQLIRKGLIPGDVVAVCGPRSFNLIASMIAAFNSGGVLLSIDDNLPNQRKQLMLREAKAKFLISIGREQREKITWASGISSENVLFLNSSPEKVLNDSTITDSASISFPQLSGNDPAYIFFTSGTTGTPKGVQGNHKGLGHFLNWQRNTFAVNPQDRAAQLTSLSFDVVLRDIFIALVSGATLCLPEDDIHLDAEKTLRWLEQSRISIIHTVPTLAQTWLINIPADISLSSLRWVFFAGEPLKDTLVQSWRTNFPNGQIVNLYGPTETTMAKCFYQIPENPLPGTQPVGRPLPDTQVCVINKSGHLCGIGEPGEIVLRTPFRTLGYINLPEENQTRFVKNPFREDDEDRLYYTGDQGCFRPDGQLDILGRMDGQIKIRGIRIELGEIETTLNNHQAIKQAVVAAWENQAYDKRLVAYVVPEALQFPKIHELKGYLQQFLPSYMIPAHFVLIDTIPLTSNGKVNRRALPEPNLQTGSETNFVGPQTQLQELLAGIWADVLRLEVVGIQDNFFDLGGHSLLATQIVSRVRRLIHVDLPLRILFEFPTIQGMSEQIDSAQQENSLGIPPLKPYLHDKPPRLSFSQERMWFLHQLAPDSAAYNMSNSVRIGGELDVGILEIAFNMIVERHAILRTTFDIIDGEPAQIIAPTRPITIPIVDLQPLSDSEQTSQVQKLIVTNAREPFDLAHGPLLRVFVIKLGEYDHILFSAMHHIVSDQWSVGVLTHEFAAIYNALSTNAPIPLDDLPVQYADYSVWQRDWLKGELLQSKLAFWKKQLDGISVLDLPADHPRPAIQTYNGSFEKLPLSPSLIGAVRNLCSQEQVTPFMFFLGIFNILLLRYTGQPDVAIGTPIANRNWYETERLIGTFVNTVVLRTQLNGNPTFKEFLHNIRNRSLDAFNHQDLPFEKLIEELQPERDMSHSPLVQVLFNMQNAPVTMPQLHKELKLTPMWPRTNAAQFDLTLSVTTDVFPHLVLTYNTDLFKQDTVIRMLGHLEVLVRGALADPSQKVLNLPMLTQAEREKQLVAWNNTRLDYPKSACIHHMVEVQAEETPDSIAVIFNDQRLTYRELNSRANQLARYLQELGVTTETPVGLSMERSAEMVIGLLGILKAGGTYIPLDPLFPQDRLEYMLENSETNILLTHERLRVEAAGNPSSRNNLRVISLDGEWNQISQYATDNLPIATQPENLAYIIFTSGSTGKPKGVQIPHRAVVNFLTSMRQKPALTGDDKLLSVTTLSFDISILEIFLPLTTGACVVVVPGQAVYDGTALTHHLSTNNITVMQATPATWQMLIEAGWQGDKNLKVLCGGEAMPKDLAKWLTQHAGAVWNMYGPTETTVWSTICEITPEAGAITVGHPIANTQIYILDKNLQPVPVGVAGELYIAGEGVARGYLKLPELTAEKFLPDPFSNGAGAFMYKTGDQARFLTDGQVDFLGRADFQVKVRGFRIELGEIETVLNHHPNVRQAVVVVREDIPGDKRLVAYLILIENHEIDPGDLRQYIRTQLPEYMVPSSFMVLNEFPLTPNRKVNRKALPAPDTTLLKTERDFVLPRTPTEEKIARIWTTILGATKTDVHDNFFDLGGHSLLATRVISQIREQFQIDLPLRTLFMTPTIAEISEAIDTILWATKRDSTSGSATDGNKDELEI